MSDNNYKTSISLARRREFSTCAVCGLDIARWPNAGAWWHLDGWIHHGHYAEPVGFKIPFESSAGRSIEMDNVASVLWTNDQGTKIIDPKEIVFVLKKAPQTQPPYPIRMAWSEFEIRELARDEIRKAGS